MRALLGLGEFVVSRFNEFRILVAFRLYQEWINDLTIFPWCELKLSCEIVKLLSGKCNYVSLSLSVSLGWTLKFKVVKINYNRGYLPGFTSLPPNSHANEILHVLIYGEHFVLMEGWLTAEGCNTPTSPAASNKKWCRARIFLAF